MIETPKQHVVPVVPSEQAFAKWVEASIKKLGLRPSFFLISDGLPGGKNRVRNFLKKPDAMSLARAHELQSEILTEAVRRGVNLDPIPVKSLSEAFSDD